MTIELTDAGRNEYEALVRDARRYRWLRDRVGVDYSLGAYRAFMACGNSALDPSATDTAIDAALELT